MSIQARLFRLQLGLFLPFLFRLRLGLLSMADFGAWCAGEKVKDGRLEGDGQGHDFDLMGVSFHQAGVPIEAWWYVYMRGLAICIEEWISVSRPRSR